MTEINGLADEIKQYLDRYGSLIADKVEIASKETADTLAKHLKTNEDVPEATGDYKKGWRVKKRIKRGKPVYIVYNKTDYQLTHLLEKGHVLRRGGRVVGEARDFPHIRPAAKKAVDDYLDKLKGIIQE